jgi:hypothetical protein
VSALPPCSLVASYCEAIYRPTAALQDWSHYDPGLDDGVCWALQRLDGFDLVVFRGSDNLPDWIHDLMVLPLGHLRPLATRIGHVHAGFFAGLEQVWAELQPLLSQPVVLSGHSLGAARADLLCGLMVADGLPPAGRIVFGEPKPGLQDAADLISHIPAKPWRNGNGSHHDLVTDAPLTLPPDLGFVRAVPNGAVTAAPAGDVIEKLGPFAWHHMPLYHTGIIALEQEQSK